MSSAITGCTGLAVRAVDQSALNVVAQRAHRQVGEHAEFVEREVSPQLLIHYRGNWYLGAWCHKQDAMRSFSMDAIQSATVLGKTSKALPKKELDGFVGQGYGIFAGEKLQWARLRFSAERARWVRRELWHPKQRLLPQADGSLILEVPFTDMRELAMDVLRQGRHVTVLEPKELSAEVRAELAAALKNYEPVSPDHGYLTQ